MKKRLLSSGDFTNCNTGFTVIKESGITPEGVALYGYVDLQTVFICL